MRNQERAARATAEGWNPNPVRASGRRRWRGWVWGLGLFLTCVWLGAEEVYQSPEAFVAESFLEAPPERQYLWLTGEVGTQVERILGHRYRQLRVAYWADSGRTVWILEEIGKVKPITVGFVIDAERIESFKVLVYRETHGWEIRFPFFVRQFEGVGLNNGDQLDASVDGISGATLSVNAVKRLARMALVLHATVVAEASS